MLLFLTLSKLNNSAFTRWDFFWISNHVEIMFQHCFNYDLIAMHMFICRRCGQDSSIWCDGVVHGHRTWQSDSEWVVWNSFLATYTQPQICNRPVIFQFMYCTFCYVSYLIIFTSLFIYVIICDIITCGVVFLHGHRFQCADITWQKIV